MNAQPISLTQTTDVMGESFQEYSWIQNFEAFYRKSVLKFWIRQFITASLIHFQFIC